MLDWFAGDIAGMVAVLLLLLVLLFRNEIRAKFGGIEQAGYGGVTFRSQHTSQVPAIPSDLKAQVNGTSLLPATTALRQQVQDGITDDLDKMKDEDKIPALVTALVTSRIERAFDAIFAGMFGSQVVLLQRLKAAGGRLSLDEAELYFEQVKASHPEFYASANIADWLFYLVKNHLVGNDGTNGVLTDTGHEFVTFVAGAKAGETRPY